MIYLRIHYSYRDVVAICDKDLLGKRFEEGKRQLDVRESFYKDKELTEEQAIAELKRMKLEDATFNIVGKDSVALAIKAEIMNEDNIAYVDKIPFALILI